MSKLSVCALNTNCATNVAGTPTGADGMSTGDFTTAGDYIIVGLVALPGTSSLGVAAEEYIVFKKISVVSADTVTSSSKTSTTGSSNAAFLASSSKDAMNASVNGSGSNFDSAAEQRVKPDLTSKESNVVSDSPTKTTTPPHDMASQTEKDMLNSTKSASVSTGSDGTGGNDVAIIAAVAGCCIVGIVGWIFLMRRRKQESTTANKTWGTKSSSLASDRDDSIESSNKIDHTFVANITARNNVMNRAEDMMSEESSTAIMSSAASGSSNGSSSHSLPKSSLDTDQYPENASYGAAGSTRHPNKAKMDAYRMSNISVLLPSASDTQSEASMSNFGDSIVSERQKQYLKPGSLNNSVSSHMNSRLDSVEQAELNTHGFGSIAGLSAVSGLSEDDTSPSAGLSEHYSDRDFSMSSRPSEDSRATVKSRYTAGYRATEDSRDSRVSKNSQALGFSEAIHQSRLQSGVSAVDSYGFRTSRSSVDSYTSGLSSYSREGSRVSKNSQALGFSEAIHQSRLQSGVSAVDSYGFRTSRSSVDSYTSGLSSYSREGSRISGFSVDSSLDSPISSKY
ncbi:unnamed protein product [Peronospora destructor]|uniref:Uncharacterized protein n=1 Tax=Peronospora destructor TaxID=86335 RepID=A0AAV0VEC1_9STRA|nr:unnamed protein product [Peronospora destructor]